jgi:hypothetical protein
MSCGLNGPDDFIKELGGAGCWSILSIACCVGPTKVEVLLSVVTVGVRGLVGDVGDGSARAWRAVQSRSVMTIAMTACAYLRTQYTSRRVED